MKLIIFIALLVPTLLTPLLTVAEQLYIDDMIFVPLRVSPGPRDRIQSNDQGRHILLKSGTAVNATEEDETNGFRQIITPAGEVGWVPKQHLRKTPVARHRLKQARAEISNLKKTIEPLKTKVTTLDQQIKSEKSTSSKEKSSLTKTINELKKANEKLTQDLNRIKSISKNAIALNDTNNALLEENERLKVDIDVLQAEKVRLQDDSNQGWFMIGAGAVSLGALLAIVAPWFKPKRKPSDYW